MITDVTLAKVQKTSLRLVCRGRPCEDQLIFFEIDFSIKGVVGF